MKWFDNTALTLVIIGALNWLLVGIFTGYCSRDIWKSYMAVQNYLYNYRTVRFISHQPLWKNWKFILKKGYP